MIHLALLGIEYVQRFIDWVTKPLRQTHAPHDRLGREGWDW